MITVLPTFPCTNSGNPASKPNRLKPFTFQDIRISFQNSCVSGRKGCSIYVSCVKPFKIGSNRLKPFFFSFYSPAGWDNEKKIAILYENMHSMRPDQYYTDVIAKPIVRKSTNNRDVEVTAEDEQQFLLR